MKSIVLEQIGKISYRELEPEEDYQPTQEEETEHGTKVITRHFGDPGPGEIETEAVYGAVCTHEVSLFLGDLTHPRYSMVPGHEAVHRVTRTGQGVTHVREGDYIAACWYMGQWSRRVIGPADMAYKLPDHMDDFSNWIIEPAASVVNAVWHMKIRPGDRVLLIGAGFMGLLMTQLVSHYPLAEFIACDVRPSSCNMAHICGARETILLTSDAGKGRLDNLGPGYFDVVIECSGTQSGLDLAVEFCGTGGKIYLFGWHRKRRSIDFKLGHLRGQQLVHTSPALDTGREYERFWPKTIAMFEAGIFDLSVLMSHKYGAEDIAACMSDSVERKDGFMKSCFYFE